MPVSKLETVGEHYKLFAQVEGNEYLREIQGVTERDGNFFKKFPRTRFTAIHADIKKAIAQHRKGEDVVVYGMSGYSLLGKERCAGLNIKSGQYEAMVSSLLIQSIRAQQESIRGINIRLAYGSSATGVDLEIENVARKENIPLLGFTCPDYLWWVNNSPDGPMICICKDKNDYCEQYIGALDILFAANGGPVSYQMDIKAATEHFKPIIALNVLQVLGASTPAFTPDGKVADAVGVLNKMYNIINFSPSSATTVPDLYPAVSKQFCATVVGITRTMVSPRRAYGIE